MAPRKKNQSIKSTGSTSSKAEPLPDWVKNKNVAKPPPKYQQQQQQKATSSSNTTEAGKNGNNGPSSSSANIIVDRPPPLFPPGTKTPINLLNERIQKHHKDWLKPSIEARRAPKGYGKQTGEEEEEGFAGYQNESEERWTFVVILTKTNKSDQSNPFVVRFDARDPSGHEGSTFVLDSKEKAKQWGATYALFRLCSNLSLDSILPTGPREYWKTLASHKQKAPEHLAWLWSPDPFEASQKMQQEKESKRLAKEKREQELENGPRLPRIWLEAREVRMAKGFRDLIEETVREALEVYPMEEEDFTIEGLQQDDSAPTSGVATSIRDDVDADKLISQLTKLGFRKGHAKSAVQWLSKARKGQSSSTSAALQSISKMSDEDACLEYLSIFCPEDDLPSSFAPSRKADSFVTSSSSTAVQGDSLAVRWIEERVVKLAGYPREAVQSALQECQSLPVESREACVLEILLLRLCNLPWQDHIEALAAHSPSEETEQLRADERMALEAVLGPERVIEIVSSERPLTSQKRNNDEMFDIIIAKKPEEDIRLRICPGDMSRYPFSDERAMPTFFVASSTLPAYLRLAMTQHLGRNLTGMQKGFEDWKEMLAAGQGGVILAMVEELETNWKRMTDDPPELREVMAGVITPKEDSNASKQSQSIPVSQNKPKSNKKRNIVATLSNDDKKNEELLTEQKRLRESTSYLPIKKTRDSLPAMASNKELMKLLDHHRLIIIAGETGCGKTTQCPQFVLDDMIEKGKGSMCNIIVTQPRRLSAMGVASRVAQERCEELNGQGMVGYSIRGESKSGRKTKLLFTTTGVLLRRLSMNDPDLRGISHVFVDEVHERGVESDMLLIELREILKRNTTLRVVLMSATIERETFTNYFPNAPILDIPGRTFPVQDYYLEDIKLMLGSGNSDEKSEEEEEVGKQRRKEGIDYELIGKVVNLICEKADQKKDVDGGILVFLPGVGEIRQAMESIQRFCSKPVDVFPLHANLSPDEQRRVFRKPKTGCRKVVVSTNVAETSITIDDIVYVVDSGLVKETRYDAQSGLTKLVETRCSQANARQRRGRAGRVRAGECFKLFTRGTEIHRMAAQQIPEMQRMSLENLILSVKALKGDSVQADSYLLSAISPPSLDALNNAIELLTEMNVLVSQRQRLTSLGKHVSLLPLDVRLGKLLVLSCIFHCLQPMLTAAAIFSCKPLFNAPFEQRQEASKARKQFNLGNSDILTDVNVYHQWRKMRKDDGIANNEIRKWCQDNFISPSTLRDIGVMRQDLLNNLIEMGFVSMEYKADQIDDNVSSLDENSKELNLQKALLLAALYPSVVRIAHPEAKYDKAIGGTIEREAEAKQVRYFDQQNQRVFLHPSSVLFDVNKYSTNFLTSFRKGASSQGQQNNNKTKSGPSSTDKVYLRDATEVPTFALLLFGGQLRLHRKEGGISMGSVVDERGSGWIKLRAGGRIASLINQLRFLLDAALAESFDDPMLQGNGKIQSIQSKVLHCLHRLLERDGQ